jgi:hypothetical protein
MTGAQREVSAALMGVDECLALSGRRLDEQVVVVNGTNGPSGHGATIPRAGHGVGVSKLAGVSADYYAEAFSLSLAAAFAW